MANKLHTNTTLEGPFFYKNIHGQKDSDPPLLRTCFSFSKASKNSYKLLPENKNKLTARH